MSQKVSDILDFLETSSDKIKGTMTDTSIIVKQGTDSWYTMTGTLLPSAHDTFDIGSAERKVRDVYIGDLHLNNLDSSGNSVDGTTGSWTFQEGEDNLFLLNNVTGKRYKVNLTEV